MEGFKINNMPATIKEYVVARWVEDELWFFGTYDTEEKAEEVKRIGSDMIIIKK